MGDTHAHVRAFIHEKTKWAEDDSKMEVAVRVFVDQLGLSTTQQAFKQRPRCSSGRKSRTSTRRGKPWWMLGSSFRHRRFWTSSLQPLLPKQEHQQQLSQSKEVDQGAARG